MNRPHKLPSPSLATSKFWYPTAIWGEAPCVSISRNLDTCWVKMLDYNLRITIAKPEFWIFKRYIIYVKLCPVAAILNSKFTENWHVRNIWSGQEGLPFFELWSLNYPLQDLTEKHCPSCSRTGFFANYICMDRSFHLCEPQFLHV